MNYLIALIVLVIFGCIYFPIVNKKNKAANKKSLNNFQIMKNQLTNNPTQEFISADNKYILSIDETARKINFITEQSHKTYDISDILGTQIIRHVSTSHKTTTRENVFGNMSSNTTTDKKISQIELKISMNDMEMPYYSILFFDSPFGVSEGHPYLEKPESKINHWIAMINIMRGKGNGIRIEGLSGIQGLPANLQTILESATAQAEITLIPSEPQDSVADELIKISNLLQQGMITQDEYNTLKSKLIS